MKEELNNFVVQSVQGVEKCILREDKGQLLLQTQGLNLQALFRFSDILDVTKIYANDIHVIAQTYGIEAANKALVKVSPPFILPLFVTVV